MDVMTIEDNKLMNVFSGIIFNEGYLGNIGSSFYSITQINQRDKQDAVSLLNAHSSIKNKIVSVNVENVFDIYSSNIEVKGLDPATNKEIADKLDKLNISRKSLAVKIGDALSIGKAKGAHGETRAITVAEAVKVGLEDVRRDINQAFKDYQASSQKPSSEKVDKLIESFKSQNEKLLNAIYQSLESLDKTSAEYKHQLETYHQLFQWQNEIESILTNINKELKESDGNLSNMRVFELGADLAEVLYGQQSTIKSFGSSEGIIDENGNIRVPNYSRSAKLRELEAPRRELFKAISITALVSSWIQLGFLLFGAKMHDYSTLSGMSYATLLACVFEYAKHSTNYLLRSSGTEFVSPDVTVFLKNINVPEEFKPMISTSFARMAKIRYSNSTIFGNNGTNQALKVWLFNNNYREIINNDTQGDTYSLMVGQTLNHNKKAAKIKYILKNFLTDELGNLKYGLNEENAKRLAYSMAIEDRDFTAYGTVMEVIARAGLHTSQGIRFARRAGKKGFENVCMNAFKNMLLDKKLMSEKQVASLDKQLIKNFNQFDILTMLNSESRENTLRWLLTKYAEQDSSLGLTSNRIDEIVNAANDSTSNKGMKQFVAEEMYDMSQKLGPKASKLLGVQVDPIDQSKAMWLVEMIIKEVEYENTAQSMGGLGNKISAGMSLNADEQVEIKEMFSIFGVKEQDQTTLLTELSADKKMEDIALHVAGVEALSAQNETAIDAAVDMVEGSELVAFFERNSHKFHQEGNLREVTRLLLEDYKKENDQTPSKDKVSESALFKAVKKHFKLTDEKAVMGMLINMSEARDPRDKVNQKGAKGASTSFSEDIRLRISENVFGADNSGKYSMRDISKISQVLGDVIARETAKVQLSFFNNRRARVKELIANGSSAEQAIKIYNIELQEAIEAKINDVLNPANLEQIISQKNMGLIGKQHFNSVLYEALNANKKDSKLIESVLPGTAESRIKGFKLFGLENFNVDANTLTSELIASGYVKGIDVSSLSAPDKDKLKDNPFLKMDGNTLYIIPGISNETITELVGFGIDQTKIDAIVKSYMLGGANDVPKLLSNIVTALTKLNNKTYLKSQFIPYERFMEQQLYEVYINAKILSEIGANQGITSNQQKWLSVLNTFVTTIETKATDSRREAFESLHELDATTVTGANFSAWMKDTVVDASMDKISSFLDETENIRRGHYNIAKRRMNEAMNFFNRLGSASTDHDVVEAKEKAKRAVELEAELKGFKAKFGDNVFSALNGIINDAIGDDVNGEFLTFEEIASRAFAILVGTTGELTFDSKNQLKREFFYKERKYQITEASKYSAGINEFHVLNMVNLLAKNFINTDGTIDIVKRDAEIKDLLQKVALGDVNVNKETLEAKLKELSDSDGVRVKNGKTPLNNDKILAIKVAIQSLNEDTTFFNNLQKAYNDSEEAIRKYVDLKKESSDIEEELFNLVPAIAFTKEETEAASELTLNFRFRLIDGLKKYVDPNNNDDKKKLSADVVTAYFKQQTGKYGIGNDEKGNPSVFDALADSIAATLEADSAPALTQTDKDRVAGIKNEFEQVFMFDRAGEPIGWRKSKAGNTNNVMLGQTHSQRLANKIHLLLDIKGMEDYSFSRRFNPGLLNELEIGIVKKIRLTDDATVDRDLKYKKGMMPDQITAFIVANIPKDGKLDVASIRKNLIESWGLSENQLKSALRFKRADLDGKLDKYIREIAVSLYGGMAVQEYSLDKLQSELDKFLEGRPSDLQAIVSAELFDVVGNKDGDASKALATELRSFLNGDIDETGLSIEVRNALSEKEVQVIKSIRANKISDILGQLSSNEKDVRNLIKGVIDVTGNLYNQDNLMGEWWTWSAQFQNWSGRDQVNSALTGIGVAVGKDIKRSMGKYIPLQELITPEARSFTETIMNMSSIGTYPEYIADHGRRLPFKQELLKIAKWMDFMEQTGIPLTEDNMFELFEILRTKKPNQVVGAVNSTFNMELDDNQKVRIALLVEHEKPIDNFADKRKYTPTATHKIKAEFIGNFDADNYAFINYVQTIGTLGVKWQFRNIKTTINILEKLKSNMSEENLSKIDALIDKIQKNASSLKYDKQDMEDILIELKGLYDLVDDAGKDVIKKELLEEQFIMNPLRWWSAIMQFGQNFESIENDLVRAQQMTDETNSKGMKQKTIAGCYNFSHINSISQVSRFEKLPIEVEDKDHFLKDYFSPLLSKIFYKNPIKWDDFWGKTMYGQFKPNDYLYDKDGKSLYGHTGTLVRKGILMPHIISTRFRTQTGSSNFYQGYRGLQVLTSLAVLSSLATATGVGIPVGIAIGILTAIAFKQIGSVASGLILNLMKLVGKNPFWATVAVVLGLVAVGGTIVLAPATLPFLDSLFWQGVNALPIDSMFGFLADLPQFIAANHYLVAALATSIGLLSPGTGVGKFTVKKYGQTESTGLMTTEDIQKNIFKNQEKANKEDSISLAKQVVNALKIGKYDYANRDDQVSIDIASDETKVREVLAGLGLSVKMIDGLVSELNTRYEKSELANTRRVWGQMNSKDKFLESELKKAKDNKIVNTDLTGVRLQGNKYFAEEEIYNEASIVEDFSTSYYVYSKGYTIDYSEDTVGVNGANSWLYPLGTQRTRWWGGMGEQEPFVKDMFKQNLDKLSTYTWYKLWCGAAGPLSAGLDRALFVNSTIFVASIVASIAIPTLAAFVVTPLVFSSAAFGGTHILVGLTVAHLSYALTLGTIRLSKMVKGATWEEASELFSLVKGPGSSIMYPESIVRKFNQRTGFEQTLDAPVPLMSEPNHWVMNYARMMANVEVLKAYILLSAGIAGGIFVNPALLLLTPVAFWSLVNKINISRGLALNHGFAREYDVDYNITSDKQRDDMQKRWDRNYKDQMSRNMNILENKGYPGVFTSNMGFWRNLHRALRWEPF